MLFYEPVFMFVHYFLSFFRLSRKCESDGKKEKKKNNKTATRTLMILWYKTWWSHCFSVYNNPFILLSVKYFWFTWQSMCIKIYFGQKTNLGSNFFQSDITNQLQSPDLTYYFLLSRVYQILNCKNAVCTL